MEYKYIKYKQKYLELLNNKKIILRGGGGESDKQSLEIDMVVLYRDIETGSLKVIVKYNSKTHEYMFPVLKFPTRDISYAIKIFKAKFRNDSIFFTISIPKSKRKFFFLEFNTNKFSQFKDEINNILEVLEEIDTSFLNQNETLESTDFFKTDLAKQLEKIQFAEFKLHFLSQVFPQRNPYIALFDEESRNERKSLLIKTYPEKFLYDKYNYEFQGYLKNHLEVILAHELLNKETNSLNLWLSRYGFFYRNKHLEVKYLSLQMRIKKIVNLFQKIINIIKDRKSFYNYFYKKNQNEDDLSIYILKIYIYLFYNFIFNSNLLFLN